jgi:hypothetical protein
MKFSDVQHPLSPAARNGTMRAISGGVRRPSGLSLDRKWCQPEGIACQFDSGGRTSLDWGLVPAAKPASKFHSQASRKMAAQRKLSRTPLIGVWRVIGTQSGRT